MSQWSDVTDGILERYRLDAEDPTRISPGFDDGTWKPDLAVTRAEFVQMAVDALGIPTADPSTPSFDDVPASSDYYRYVEGAAAAGLLDSIASATFAPETIMTHEQCLALVMRAVAQATGISLEQAYPIEVWASALARYSDNQGVDSGLKREVAMAVKHGVLRPEDSGDTLSPQGRLTRIEAAAAITRGKSVCGDRIGVLGVGGGPPFQTVHDNPGFLLIVDGTGYMIDCGGSTPNNILRLGFPLGAVKHLFFTHLHIDHTMGYADLLARGQWTVPDPLTSLEVWGQPGLGQFVDGANRYLAVPVSTHHQHKMWQPVIHELTLPDNGIERVMEDERVVVSATRVCHDDLDAYAYRFDVKATGKSVVFAGDIDPDPRDPEPGHRLLDLANNVDILVHEVIDSDLTQALLERVMPDPVVRANTPDGSFAHHIDAKVVPKIAKRANAKALVLSHYTPGGLVTRDGIFAKTLAAARETGYTGRVIGPVELDVIGF